MATAGVYYVRSRGRITGPFDVALLQKMVQRGALSRTHEISSDRASWTPASNVAELFPTAQPSVHPTARSGASQPAGAASQGVVSPSPARSASPSPSTQHYFYSQGGVNVGPLRGEVLQNLVKNGTVLADDMVWSEGSTMAVPARQVPMLAAMFTAVPEAIPRPGAARPSVTLDTTIFSAFVGIAGLVAGILLLLLLNLPWFIPNGTPVWWWTIASQTPSALPTIEGVLLLLAGIALCLVSFLARGVLRGVVFIVVTGVVGLSLIADVCSVPDSGPALIGFLILYGVPAITSCVSASARARSRLLGVTSATAAQMTVAIVLAVAATILLMVAVNGGAVVPLVLRPFFVVFILALLAAAAAAILAIVDAAKGTSRPLNLWATYCADASLALQVLVVVFFVVAVAREAVGYGRLTDSLPVSMRRGMIASSVTIILLRAWLLTFVPALLAGIGIAEILLASHARRPTPGRPAYRPPTQTTAANALSQITD